MTPTVFAVFVFISTVVAAGTVIGLLIVAGTLVGMAALMLAMRDAVRETEFWKRLE